MNPLGQYSTPPSDAGLLSLTETAKCLTLAEIADQLDATRAVPESPVRELLWSRLRAIADALRERERAA